MLRAILTIYAVSVAYSVVRYVVFAPKNIENLPVFVVNKGVSMAAALCFAAGFYHAWRKSHGVRSAADPATWFRAGVFGVVWHIPISLAILNPAYFGEFFRDATDPADPPRMTFAGEMVFLFGGLAAALIFLSLRSGVSARGRRLISVAAMAALALHILSMGYSRGLNINAGHAYLPPMWLLSAIAALLAMWWAATPVHRSDEKTDR